MRVWNEGVLHVIKTEDIKAFLRHRMFTRGLVFLSLVLFQFPNIVFIFLDHSLFRFNCAVYGKAALVLFNAIVYSPGQWPRLMIDVLPIWTPMVYWIGQLFVGLRFLFGSTDKALLFSMTPTLILTMVVLYQGLRRMGDHKTIALTGCLVVAAAPLYMSLAVQYFAEALQVLTVVWFIYILSSYSRWDRLYGLLQLIAAFSFGQLVKTSTVLYVCVPFIFVLAYILECPKDLLDWKPRRHGKISVFAASLFTLFLLYYVRNFSYLYKHGVDSAGLMWGEHLPFVKKFFYWMNGLDVQFFIVSSRWVVLLVLAAASIMVIRRKFKQRLDILMVVCSLQMVLFLVIYSFLYAKDVRFIVALLPYVSLMVSWGLKVINKRTLTAVVFGVFLFQFVIVNLLRFDLMASKSSHSEFRHIDLRGKDAKFVHDFTQLLRPDLAENKGIFISGISVSVKEDISLDLYSNSQGLILNNENSLGCIALQNLNDPGFKLSEYVFKSLSWVNRNKPLYYLSLSREGLLNAKDSYLHKDAILQLLDNIEASGLYERMEFPLGTDRGYALYRRKNSISKITLTVMSNYVYDPPVNVQFVKHKMGLLM